MGPVLYMASTKILVGFLGILLAFAPTLYRFYDTGGRRAGACRRSTTSTSPGLIMALEQSIVMGIALAYLFFRMLAESEAEDQRAERYARRRAPARASTRRFRARARRERQRPSRRRRRARPASSSVSPMAA